MQVGRQREESSASYHMSQALRGSVGCGTEDGADSPVCPPVDAAISEWDRTQPSPAPDGNMPGGHQQCPAANWDLDKTAGQSCPEEAGVAGAR